MSKVDSPEGTLFAGGGFVKADAGSDFGWGVVIKGIEWEKYIQDLIVWSLRFYYMPGREDRVRKWIAKNRLMNPNFDFNVAGPWSEEVKHGKG